MVNAIAQVELVDTLSYQCLRMCFYDKYNCKRGASGGPFNLTDHFPETPNVGAVARGDPKKTVSLCAVALLTLSATDQCIGCKKNPQNVTLKY